MQALTFIILNESFNLHHLKPGVAIPKTVFDCAFYSITSTHDEISILVPENVKIDANKTEHGWRALKVAGQLDFSLTGILAGIAATLSEAGISIFALSTYDTDYILVKNERLLSACAALIAAGHHFSPTTLNPE
ncbi:MAG: ACT domain-containing protein [Chloroflexi bacterium]|nr:ACT domain-containing protein [Chloroflexota bacterium]